MSRECATELDDGSQDSLSTTVGSISIPGLFPHAAVVMDPMAFDLSHSGLFPHTPTAPCTHNDSFSRCQYTDDGEGQLLMPPYDPTVPAQFALPEGMAWRPARRHVSVCFADGDLSPRRYVQDGCALTWAEEEESSRACEVLADQMRRCLSDDAHLTLPSMTSEETQARLQKRDAVASQPPSETRSAHRVGPSVDGVTPSPALLSQYRAWWHHERLQTRGEEKAPVVPANHPNCGLTTTLSPRSPLPSLTVFQVVSQMMSNNSESGYLTGSFENATRLTSQSHPLQSAFSANVSLPTAFHHHRSFLDDEPLSPGPLTTLQPPLPPSAVVLGGSISTSLPHPPPAQAVSQPLVQTRPISPTPPVSQMPTPVDKSASGHGNAHLHLPALTLSVPTSRIPSKPASPLLHNSRRASAVPSLLQSPVVAGMPPSQLSSGHGNRRVNKPHPLTVFPTNDSFYACAGGAHEDSLSSLSPQHVFMLEPREPISAGSAEPLRASEYQPHAVARGASSGNNSTSSGGESGPAPGKTRFGHLLRLFSPLSRDSSETFKPGSRLVGAPSRTQRSSSTNTSGSGHFGSSPPSAVTHAARRGSNPLQNQYSFSSPHVNTAPNGGGYAPVARTESAIDTARPSTSAPDLVPLCSTKSI